MNVFRLGIGATVAIVSGSVLLAVVGMSGPPVPQWRVGTAPAVGALAGPATPVGLAVPASPSPKSSPRPTHSSSPSPTPSAKSTKKPAVSANVAAGLRMLPSSTSQVVVVHAPTADTTYATLETFNKVNGGWVKAFSAMSARIGRKGFSSDHVEGVQSTPIGVYSFGDTIYGINPDPGVKFAYHRLVTNDWWNENSGTPGYNTLVHTTTNPGAKSEALWENTVDYQYFAFVNYNVPAVAGRGSAIFLHVRGTKPTAGCIAIPKADLVEVLTWLDPAKHPRIVLSPDGDLHNF